MYAATTSWRRNGTKKAPAVYIVFDAQRVRKRTVRVAYDAPLSFFDGKHARTAGCAVHARHNEIPLLKITGVLRTFEECESEGIVGPSVDLLLNFLRNFAAAPVTTSPAQWTEPFRLFAIARGLQFVPLGTFTSQDGWLVLRVRWRFPFPERALPFFAPHNASDETKTQVFNIRTIT